MSLKNKFLHSILIGATVIGLAAQLTTPARAADTSDVTLGLLGGLVIAGVIYQNKYRRDNRDYARVNQRHSYHARDRYRYATEHNGYGNKWRGRHQSGHGRHNRRHSRYRY